MELIQRIITCPRILASPDIGPLACRFPSPRTFWLADGNHPERRPVVPVDLWHRGSVSADTDSILGRRPRKRPAGISIGTRGGHPVELCRSDGLRSPFIARFLIGLGILWMSLSLSFCRLDVVPRGTPTRRFPTLPSSLVRPGIDDSAAMDTLGSCSSIPNGTMSS